MNAVTDLMYRGGPFMWPLLLLLMCGPVAVFAAFGMSLARLRVPLLVWLAIPLTAAAVGELGAVQGLTMAEDAVGHASMETAPVLAAAGISVALVSSYVGWFLAALLGGLSAGSLGLVTLLARGEAVRWTASHALLLGSSVVVGVMLAAAVSGPWVALGVALLVGAAVPAALKADALEEPEAAPGRLAGVRLQAVASGVFALLAFARGRHLQGISERLMVVAHASAETRQAMLAATAFIEPWGALAAAAVLALGGGVAVLLVVRQLPLQRAAVGGAVLGLGGLMVVGAAVASDLTQQRLSELTVPWEEAQAALLQERGIELPQVDSLRWASPETVLYVSADSVWLGDDLLGSRRVSELRDGMHPGVFSALDQVAVNQAGPYGFRGRLLLLAPASARAGELAPVLGAVAGARFFTVDLAVQTEHGLRTLRADLGLPAHTDAGSATPSGRSGEEEERERYVELVLTDGDAPPHEEAPLALELSTSPSGTQLLGVHRVFDGPPPLVDGPEALRGQLEAVKAEYPDEEMASITVHHGLSLQELAELLSVLQGSEEDPLFPYVTLRFPSDR